MSQLYLSVTGVATSGSTIYACATDMVLAFANGGWHNKCQNMTSSGENAQLCYCHTALCNDITRCVCNTGDSYRVAKRNATRKTERN